MKMHPSSPPESECFQQRLRKERQTEHSFKPELLYKRQGITSKCLSVKLKRSMILTYP
jgi:hypothetical protein